MVGAPPLTGIKVLEFAGLAPGPFAGMTLADAGASVLRVNRHDDPPQDMLARRKASVAVDLKDPRGIALLKQLIASAPIDVLIDPFRPGVLERLGLGPQELLRLHPRLVYARVTGYRRDGRYAAMAGHDINYLGVSGALSLLGPPDRPPQPPVNILGDFAGGGATLVQGILLALLARERSSSGQVVEANMVDGSSYLASFPRMARATPLGDKPRGRNALDAVGCPWYRCYETADARFVTVGALEPKFFAELLRGLGLEGQGWEEERGDEARWPELRALFAERFRARTREAWEAVFDGTDACVAPVLDYDELRSDPRREGDQRPAVTLRETPWYAVHRGEGGEGAGAGAKLVDVADRGQGGGVEGEGYDPTLLDVGEGGDEMLGTWLGWKRGTHYEDASGRGLTLISDKAKI
ncbi:alpha-methylacyl-CoA racemase [Cordyceps fumosorosea ARSEF 2679]|uniref:Alpha-methylacyl-CoA racemase n=1 Tax=Cordyceps fumosorosea (strain ARSEF 2679) TaxID=1081104 RepID=A0A162MS56_CORFA|nr:alpha-methylacyl-CoA racemase [Cordyceps fumosorosea ARSEF 2679]OAA66080.1 alpha-methylacyl-CoA racemase [Cordyceps fumosorosea ARSEF 2679]